MIDDELDLINGDSERAERIAEAGPDRTSRVARASKRSTTTPSRSRSKSGGSSSSKSSANDLAPRFRAAFDKLADRLLARDEELATAIREESEGMASGLMSVTKTVPFLRGPLLIFFGVLEPVLAFWRVGGILTRRWLDRRQARANAVVAEQASVEYVDPLMSI